MQDSNQYSRKSFLYWGTALLSALAVMRIVKCSQKKKGGKETGTVKMLGQDGRLVEVDVSALSCGKRKKISDKELQNWVTNGKERNI